MPLKHTTTTANDISLFDDAVVIYQRGAYWQFRMWLANEKKYARFSLRTKNVDVAKAKAKTHYHQIMHQQMSGQCYFSKTTKQGVDAYLAQRAKDVETRQIVKGRYSTIKTHLEHWLAFIGRDTKLKSLSPTDCEDYLYQRTKTKKKLTISQTTVANEQSTINAMTRWLYKHNEIAFETFDFKPLNRIDRGDERLRRSVFTDEEIVRIQTHLETLIIDGQAGIDDGNNLTQVVTAYYLLIAMVTGLRRGEQLQLRWCDIEWLDMNIHERPEDETQSLVKITVRAETTKVRTTRHFVVKDWEYFEQLFKLLQPLYTKANRANKAAKAFGDTLIFSTNGTTPITARAIRYSFEKVMALAEIANRDTRDLVPYSFRHYFITDRINRGATPTQVAETCGTSIAQIERTYYHTSVRKMIENAMEGFYYKDGLLIPK